MDGKWYGPVRAERWVKDFAPKPSVKVKDFAFKDITLANVAATGETNVSFVNALTESKILEERKLFCKDTRQLLSHLTTSNDIDDADTIYPDVCFFGFEGPVDMGVMDRERIERLAGDTLCFANFHRKNTQDPCLHITSDPDRTKIHSKDVTQDEEKISSEARRKLTHHARAICENSHRVHLYGFVVLPVYARLLFFDQSGVCYSELFKWRETSHLSHFLQLFAAAGDVGRGIDTSVEKIPADDKLVQEARQIFKEAEKADSLPDGVSCESVFKASSAKDATYWRCDVYDEHLKIFHRVLFYRLHSLTPYFMGRATRGYIAVDIDRRAVVYMKRSWRIDLEYLPKERETYRRFAEAGVPHLPDCYFGGDVPHRSGQFAREYLRWKETAPEGAIWTPAKGELKRFVRTKVSRYIDAHGHEEGLKDARCGETGRTELKDDDIEMLPHVLTVTLFGKIGTRLRDYKTSRQLCTALMHAVETHQAAFEKTKILHRDISSGNILIYKVPGGHGAIEGLLIDWDLCVCIDNDDARRKQRTGTWEFMSARMLRDPEGCVHEVLDDLESVVHLLYHHTLRYRPTVPVPARAWLHDNLRGVFNRVLQTDTGTIGSEHKVWYLTRNLLSVENALSAVRPQELRVLLRRVRVPYDAIYTRPPDDDFDLPCAHDELAEHNARVAEAKRKCTHEFILNLFRCALGEENSWLQDGPAEDQFLLAKQSHHSVPELSQVDAVSVHDPSVLTNTKRKAETAAIDDGEGDRGKRLCMGLRDGCADA